MAPDLRPAALPVQGVKNLPDLVFVHQPCCIYINMTMRIRGRSTASVLQAYIRLRAMGRYPIASFVSSPCPISDPVRRILERDRFIRHWNRNRLLCPVPTRKGPPNASASGPDRVHRQRMKRSERTAKAAAVSSNFP